MALNLGQVSQVEHKTLLTLTRGRGLAKSPTIYMYINLYIFIYCELSTPKLNHIYISIYSRRTYICVLFLATGKQPFRISYNLCGNNCLQ